MISSGSVETTDLIKQTRLSKESIPRFQLPNLFIMLSTISYQTLCFLGFLPIDNLKYLKGILI